MESKVLEIYKGLINLPIIWPSWDHTTTPIAFYDDKKAILFSHPNPPQEFKQVVKDNLSYYICEPKPKHFTANTSMLVNGVETATIRFYDGDFDSLLGLTVHEAFHVYQANNHFPMASLALQYPSFDALVNTFGEIEGKLLYKAVITKDVRLVKQAIDARFNRQARLTKLEIERINKLTESEKEQEKETLLKVHTEASAKNLTLSTNIIQYEDFLEFHEGLAVYTEMKALSPKTQRFSERLKELLYINENGNGASRQRFYSSGMAYGLLLDQFVPGWQEILMKDWRPLSTILALGINYNPDANKREYTDLDFDKILSRQQTQMKEKIDTLTKMVNDAFPKKGILVNARLKGNPISGGWNPLTVQSLPDGSRLHTTMMLYNYDNEAEICINKGVIEKSICQHFLFECKDAMITINNQIIEIGEYTGSINITSDDWKLIVPQAKIKFDGTELDIVEIINN